MKKLAILLILVGLCLAGADISKQALPFDHNSEYRGSIQRAPERVAGRTIIAEVGDVRTVMGPQGKSIAVSSDGMTITSPFGPPSDPYDPNQTFAGVYVAYSTDMGANWGQYGPHSIASPLRRIYPGVDGGENFHIQAGNVFFVWQEGQLGYDPMLNYTMLEENVPSSPSFSSPVLLAPDAYDIDGWWACPGVNPDDNTNIMITALSFLANGNNAHYAWISTDGGYTWSDTIRVTDPIWSVYYPSSMGAGSFRWGTGGYAFFNYTDTLGGADYPHYVESTDGGYTWSAPDQLPAISQVQHWWHERDCEVINNMPFAAHNDLGDGGVFQLFYPDPDDPGSIGSWNWVATNVNTEFDGVHVYQGTTYTTTHIQYPSISFGTVATDTDPIEVILVSFKANYEIAPPPAGWTDGNYLGGILSTDGGRNWYPTRPMSGPLLQAVGGATEVAHDLVTMYWAAVPTDTTYVYTVWTDADDSVIGYQYFELGVLWAIEDSIFGPGYHGWDPGVAENNNDVIHDTRLTILPSVTSVDCRIVFNISNPGEVLCNVYDATGRLVNTAFNGYLDKGDHFINLSTSNLANGVYIVAVESPSGIDVGKVIVNR